MWNYNRKFGTYGMIIMVLMFVMPFNISVSNAQTVQSIDTGILDLKFNEEIVGKLVYRTVYNENTAVTTLEPDYGGVAPFHPYFAESLKINDTTFFLSNTIVGFEIFEDFNSNGFIDSVQEIKYFVFLNATQGFTFGNITEQVNPDNVTYQWTSNYFDIDGFLFQGGEESVSSSTETFVKMSSEIVKTVISSFNISYNVVETANFTELSIKYDIGTWDVYNFNFDNFGNEIRIGTVDLNGLGLSILYTAVIRSESAIQRITSSRDDIISEIKIKSDDIVLFEAKLNESYTLNKNSTAIPVKTVIAPADSFSQDQNVQWSIFDDYLDNIRSWYFQDFDLPAIPAENIPKQEIFNYRISYPDWSGGGISHDPIYRINKLEILISIEPELGFLPLEASNLLIISLVAGLLVLGVVVRVEKRKHK